jgi:hypothetical protein
MNYKIGDKVVIHSQEWVDEHKMKDNPLIGEYIMCGKESFLEDMFAYTGAVATIEGVYPSGTYSINLDDGEWSWTDEMFEGRYESA